MASKTQRLSDGLSRFVELTEEETQYIDKLDTTERLLEQGSTLIEFGSVIKYLYVIHSGWVAACRYVENGDRQILDIYLPGQIVCMRLVGNQIAAANFESMSDVVVSPVAISDISDLIERFPRLANVFMVLMTRQDGMLAERLINVGRRKAPRRLAHLLLELRSRAGSRELEFEIPLTQEMLADTLGITSVHVSRTFKSLENRGLLKYVYGKIKILDLEGLREFADFNTDYLEPNTVWIRSSD